MELLHELNRQGATLCMVTHDARYAATASRNVHLFDGHIVEPDFEDSHSSVGAQP